MEKSVGLLLLLWTFAQGNYINPVLRMDFPDPCVIRLTDRTYYAYGTNGCDRGCVHIQLASSQDLVHWDYIGDALPNGVSWGSHLYWAPDVTFRDGMYYMYFAAQQKNPQEMCIGVALSADPRGPFKDSGKPMLCDPNFAAIDPKAFDDPSTGKKYLFWGSDFQPIRVQELAPNRLEFAAGSSPIAVMQTSNLPYQSLIEGTWIHFMAGSFYMFWSGDNCCGPQAHYAVMIAQSKSLLGPYNTLQNATGASSNVIMQLNEKWIAPGHNSVVRDDAGDYWMMYHAISVAGNNNNTRFLMMDKIDLQSQNGMLWPSFAGGSPSTGSTASPIIRP